MVRVTEKVQQTILANIEKKGVAAAVAEYAESYPPLSVERARIQRVFSQLVQDTETGKWSFRP